MSVKFEYPAYASPVVGSLILPNPEPEETTTIPTRVIMNRFMSGKVTTAVDLKQKSMQQELLTFVVTSAKDFFEARAFFKAAQGKYVLYTDMEGNAFKCQIMSNIEYSNVSTTLWQFSVQLKKYA